MEFVYNMYVLRISQNTCVMVHTDVALTRRILQNQELITAEYKLADYVKRPLRCTSSSDINALTYYALFLCFSLVPLCVAFVSVITCINLECTKS